MTPTPAFDLDGLSPEAARVIADLPPHGERPVPPDPDDIPAWQALQADIEVRARPLCEAARADSDADVAEGRFADLDAVIITPRRAAAGVRPAVFLHGGAYTRFSARSSLFASLPLADALACPVIALDYPLAPAATFRSIVPSTAAALDAVGCELGPYVLIGDSAGGGLALSACRRTIADELAVPDCLVLLSPWTDLGNSGDSHRALADIDPVLAYDPGLRLSAAAYAPGAEGHPDASPLLADYDAGFPPTLIVCGSREILLSDSLRLHRRLRAAGATAEIDVHDGLFHSFTTVAPKSPEAAEARSGIRRFVDRNRL
jgi:monoterpene epsilon-lactone hydrolase